MNVVVTSCVPPNTGVVTLTLPSATSMSVLFVSTGLSSSPRGATARRGPRSPGEDDVGHVAAIDHRLHRRGDRGTGQPTLEVTGLVALVAP